MGRRHGTAADFWARVDMSGPGCWEWQGCTDRCGYGKVGHLGKTKRAHRRAYELSNGPIDPGLCVCHRCDNPRCCNPGHLFLGTHADNMSDRDAKNPHRGEDNRNAKLTDSNVRAIREARKGGESLRSVARRMGIAFSNVRRVEIGETWSHVQ